MKQPHSPPPSLDWCLFLDVDGTLIELTETPFDTRASDELKAVLKEVAERLGGALALVSGRSVEYLDALFAPLRLPSAGLHGVERRKATGAMHGASFIDSQLDRARTALAGFVHDHAGTLLEDKGRTVAVHYRLAPQFEPEVREAVTDIAAALGTTYHVQAGSMMLEIKPRGFNKGSAVKAFMQEPPFSGRRPVYVGDDLTDLDGFRVVDDQGGVSIAVGGRVQGQYCLDDPAAVREWLKGIAGLIDSHHE
jgi:trehalose 6-phosphate phosphatase